MAYDEDLADRIRVTVGTTDHVVTEKHMFGGLAFLLDGNMAVAASGQGGLLLRVEPAETDTLLREQHVSPMEMRGREMAGWIRVASAGLESDDELRRWVALGLARAASLPAK